MARLFVVPAIIVCLLLAVAVVVVLFGTSSLDEPETVDQLLSQLELGGGGRTMGRALLPADKAYWQAAQLLSQRLADKDSLLAPHDIEPTARRLIAVLDALGPGPLLDETARRKQYFVMMALAQLETESAVEPLAAYLDDPKPGTRIAAMRALAVMSNVPGARRTVRDMLPLLEDGRSEVEIVACAAVASLGVAGDAAAIQALDRKLASTGEVQWNAAMALARLGSHRGKRVLLNMLERSYWETLDLDYEENHRRVRRRYTPLEVSNNLKAAIEAASHLRDANVSASIDKLRDDGSYAVVEAARLASERMGSAARPTPGSVQLDASVRPGTLGLANGEG
jgi:HEAT repeat protein